MPYVAIYSNFGKSQVLKQLSVHINALRQGIIDVNENYRGRSIFAGLILEKLK